MADKTFERTIINPRERPISTDINWLESQLDRATRDTLRALLGGRTSAADPTLLPLSGFLADGLRVVPSAGLTVAVKAGLGFLDAPSDVPGSISGVSKLDDLSSYKPMVLSADQTIGMDTAPGAGNSRIDIIEVKYDRRIENPTSRDVFDSGLGKFAPATVNKTLAWDLLGRNGRVVSPSDSTTGIGYKVGVAYVGVAYDATKIPATTAGYIKVATIYVGPAAASIVENVIRDDRPMLAQRNAGRIALKIGNINGSGSSLLTLPSVVASPGLKFAVLQESSDVVSFYLFGPVANVVPAVGAVKDLGTGTAAVLAGVRSIATGNADSTLQTAMANAATTTPAIAIPVGMPYTHIVFALYGLGGGSIDNPAVANLTVDFTMQ